MDRQKLATFVLGGVAGAAAGILAAPRSGRETRGSILNRANEARERGRESYFEARERARERSSGRREASYQQDDTHEMTPGGFDLDADEPAADEPAAETAKEPGGDRLRAVAPEEEAASGEDQDEVRRRIDQTRQRLRRRRG